MFKYVLVRLEALYHLHFVNTILFDGMVRFGALFFCYCIGYIFQTLSGLESEYRGGLKNLSYTFDGFIIVVLAIIFITCIILCHWIIEQFILLLFQYHHLNSNRNIVYLVMVFACYQIGQTTNIVFDLDKLNRMMGVKRHLFYLFNGTITIVFIIAISMGIYNSYLYIKNSMIPYFRDQYQQYLSRVAIANANR